MAKLAIKKASTDVTVYVFIQASNVTTGAGLTGLVYNTTDLVASYVRPKAARAALSLATQTVTGAHSDGGFVEVDATNMPGVYRLDLPDAVCATGVNSVVVMLKGAANMAPLLLEIQLTDFDLNTAAITAATIADAVWDEATADHTTATTFGGKNQKVVPSETINDYKADVSAITGASLSATGIDAILDEIVVGTYTMRQILKLMAAKMHGKATGGGTTSIKYTGLDNVADVIIETVDTNGNRSAVSLTV